MVLNLPTFQAYLPEFSGTSAPSSATFALWEGEAENELDATRLGASLPLAIALFVAHNLALNAEAARIVANGGVLGDTIAAVSSESVGGVSVSYDTSDAAIQGAGAWNATSYGQRLFRLIKSFSVGGLYVSTPARFPPRPGFGYFGR